jgi:glycopeptide antibiotics resistance protein
MTILNKAETEICMILKSKRGNFLTYNDKTLRYFVAAVTAMYFWLLIWALVFKFGNENLLVNIYANLKDMTLYERIMWDIVPFNYRGEGLYKAKIIMDTVLNLLVFAPFGVLSHYLFKKTNVFCDIACCFGISLLIELIQLATMLGNPATEDLITNTAGYFIGFAIYRLVFCRLSVKHSVRFFAVIAVVLAVTVVFSVITMIPSLGMIYKIVTRSL